MARHPQITEADVPQNIRQMVRDYCRNDVTAGQTVANIVNAMAALPSLSGGPKS